MVLTSRQQVDEVFEGLFSLNNPDGRIVLAYIQKVLCQYGLWKAYEAKDILVEVYSRCVQTTEKGETIRIPVAWIKRTATNVIRELKREAEKIDFYKLEQEPYWTDDFLLTITFRYDLKAMKQAFECLDSEDQKLLSLRVINRLSWREVSQHFVVNGEVEANEGALRQRGFRALKKLRKLYEEERSNIRINFAELDLD
jgi:DNA-directed RNA polymerase specialized sigma24 family protein